MPGCLKTLHAQPESLSNCIDADPIFSLFLRNRFKSILSINRDPEGYEVTQEMLVLGPAKTHLMKRLPEISFSSLPVRQLLCQLFCLTLVLLGKSEPNI